MRKLCDLKKFVSRSMKFSELLKVWTYCGLLGYRIINIRNELDNACFAFLPKRSDICPISSLSIFQIFECEKLAHVCFFNSFTQQYIRLSMHLTWVTWAGIFTVQQYCLPYSLRYDHYDKELTLKRRSPTGGSAYGMPKNSSTMVIEPKAM